MRRPSLKTGAWGRTDLIDQPFSYGLSTARKAGATGQRCRRSGVSPTPLLIRIGLRLRTSYGNGRQPRAGAPEGCGAGVAAPQPERLGHGQNPIFVDQPLLK